jgi:hypothetical protein
MEDVVTPDLLDSAYVVRHAADARKYTCEKLTVQSLWIDFVHSFRTV